MMTQSILTLPVKPIDRGAWLEDISEAGDIGNVQNFVKLRNHYPALVNHLDLHIDYENIFFSFKRMGRRFFAEDIIMAIQSSLREQGEIVSGTAYADWGRINHHCRCDIQRIFEEKSIHTRYTLTGKNSADMALANNVRDSLETDLVKANTIVIVSGDGDFLPVAKTIKQRGKRLIVLACAHTMNTAYKEHANEVILLDKFLETKFSRLSQLD
jgi:uncharacterized LabA/DUF88 family protein